MTALEIIAVICIVTGFLLISYIAWAAWRMSIGEMPDPPEEDRE